MKIGDVAEVLRCQYGREPADADEKPDRELIWNEVRPDNLDPLTGFVMPENLAVVALRREPFQFGLRKNDIVLYFQGVTERIGQAGLVIDRINAIPSRLLCIIRPQGCDPLGLYWKLRQPGVRRELAAQAACNRNTGKSFLSLDRIRGYELGEMHYSEAQSVHTSAVELIETYRESRQRQSELIAAIGASLGWEKEEGEGQARQDFTRQY